MGISSVWAASIGDQGITLAPYDFPGSAFYPGGLCRWEDVREIDPQGDPEAVRTEHEVLFVSSEDTAALVQAATARGIASVRRLDVWGFILEPFLDTSFDADDIAKTYATLERGGVSRTMCDEIRARLTPAMTAYNLDSMLWDWCHLGLCDALCALRGQLSGRRHRWPDAEFAAFYRQAMALALRAPVTSSTSHA